MAAETRSTLAGYFVAGAEPTAAQFETLIYSVANVRDVNRFTSSLHNTGSVHFQSTLDVVGAATITGSLKLSSTFSGNRREIELVTADDTLTAAESGKLFVFNDADGAVLTLPDSGGGDITGVWYDFYINVTATSNAHKVICTDTGNEDIYGVAYTTDTDTSDAVAHFAALDGDSFDYISADGTTTGIQGSSWRVTNIAADKWWATVISLDTGSPATPFGST